MMLYFLLHQSKTWKDKYIRAMITLAGPWGGSVRALSIFAVGDNLGNWMLSEKKLMWEQRTSSSLAWLMPQKGFWEPDDVLVQTSSTNYTVEDYQRFFSDLDEPLAWNMREDTMRLLPGLPAPGVEVNNMSFYLSCLSTYHVFLPIMSFYSLQTRLTTPREGFLHTRVRSSDHQNACLWRGRVPRIRSNYDQGRWRWNCQLAKLGGMYKVTKCHSLVFPLPYNLNRLLKVRASCITIMP